MAKLDPANDLTMAVPYERTDGLTNAPLTPSESSAVLKRAGEPAKSFAPVDEPVDYSEADCDPILGPNYAPEPGAVYCDACERWYPPTSVHATMTMPTQEKFEVFQRPLSKSVRPRGRPRKDAR